jgi:hypothetical protein
MSQTPGAIRVLAKGQVLQMVPDVFTRCDRFDIACHSKSCLFQRILSAWPGCLCDHRQDVFKLQKFKSPIGQLFQS